MIVHSKIQVDTCSWATAGIGKSLLCVQNKWVSTLEFQFQLMAHVNGDLQLLGSLTTLVANHSHTSTPNPLNIEAPNAEI